MASGERTPLIAGNWKMHGSLAESHELVAVTGSWYDNGKLLAPAAEAWELMRVAAAEDGIDLKAIDTYRTWESQNRAHQKFLSGEKKANVLPPGTSRHGAGLAVDITNGAIIGRDDAEWHWLQAWLSSGVMSLAGSPSVKWLKAA